MPDCEWPQWKVAFEGIVGRGDDRRNFADGIHVDFS
jgi:hypothetical protein